MIRWIFTRTRILFSRDHFLVFGHVDRTVPLHCCGTNTTHNPSIVLELKSGRTFSSHEQASGKDTRAGFIRVRSDFQLVRASGRRPQNRAKKTECKVAKRYFCALAFFSPAGGCRCVSVWCSSLGGLFGLSSFFGRRPKKRSLSACDPAREGRRVGSRGHGPQNHNFQVSPYAHISLVVSSVFVRMGG